MRRFMTLAAALTAALLVGCGSDKPKPVDADQLRKAELEELGDMLKTLAADGKKPPAKMTDLGDLEPMLPTAGPGLRNGETVYFWGAAFVDGGTTVIAHEKKVPAEGGWVLVQNGSVKQMTAAEFAAAPRAKK